MRSGDPLSWRELAANAMRVMAADYMPRRRPPAPAAPRTPTEAEAEAERIRNAKLKRSRKAAKLKERGRL